MTVAPVKQTGMFSLATFSITMVCLLLFFYSLMLRWSPKIRATRVSIPSSASVIEITVSIHQISKPLVSYIATLTHIPCESWSMALCLVGVPVGFQVLGNDLPRVRSSQLAS